jgi:hypothetical protein
MTHTASRAEAHLWLLLEEALIAAGRGGEDVWEVQRQFRSVSDALLAAGVVAPGVAGRLRYELDDALVVRGLLPPASFTAMATAAAGLEDVDAAPNLQTAVAEDGTVWLEAELERHLDLLASRDPAVNPGAGAEALRILAGPVRALEAAGALGDDGHRLVADFATSIAAAGFEVGRGTATDGRVRREWARFLRDRPEPWPADQGDPIEVRHPRMLLGTLRGRAVRVDEVGWSSLEVGIRLALRPLASVERHLLDADDLAPWSVRAVDDRGRLHLGAPVPPVAEAGGGLRVRLRPGLAPGVQRLDLRVTARGARLEGSVLL